MRCPSHCNIDVSAEGRSFIISAISNSKDMLNQLTYRGLNVEEISLPDLMKCHFLHIVRKHKHVQY